MILKGCEKSDGPLLVLSYAGTGKTRVLTAKTSKLIIVIKLSHGIFLQ